MGAALCLPYLGPVARAFGFVPLPPSLLAASLAIVAGYIVCTEAIKRWLQRAGAREPLPRPGRVRNRFDTRAADWHSLRQPDNRCGRDRANRGR